MDGEVDATFEERGLDLLDEQAGVADPAERAIGDPIALGLDDLDLDLDLRMSLAKRVEDGAGLDEGEPASPAPDAQLSQR
jgi:hypothetical protein